MLRAFQRLVLLGDYFGLTLDELVKDIDVQDVREKNINNEKVNAIYDDVKKAKGIVRGYLIGAGAMAGVVLICLIYFIINAVFRW